MVLPSGQRSRVKALVTYEGDVPQAFPPMAVTVVLEDEIDVSRGSMLVHPANLPRLEQTFEAMVVWMAEEPLVPGKAYLVKHTANIVNGSVTTLHYRVDVNTLRREPATRLSMNDVARCTIAVSRPLPVDPYRHNRALGAFILIDRMTNRTVGAGMVVDRRTALEQTGDHWSGDTREAAASAAATTVTAEERAARYGQRPVTVLLTGLAGSGKSTLAARLERRLFDEGRAVSVLDGRQMRQTISRDLGIHAWRSVREPAPCGGCCAPDERHRTAVHLRLPRARTRLFAQRRVTRSAPTVSSSCTCRRRSRSAAPATSTAFTPGRTRERCRTIPASRAPTRPRPTPTSCWTQRRSQWTPASMR